MSVPVCVDQSSDEVLPALAGFQRPRLRDDVPVMWRSDSAIQIGEDVVVDRVSRSHVAWLSSLDGLHSPTAIVEALTIPEQEAARLVRALLAAGALEDAARIPETLRWLPQPERDIAAGRFAATLAAYRSPDLAFASVAARDRCRIVVLGTGLLADEVRSSLAAAGMSTAAEHGTFTILADAPHPDVASHFDDPAQDLPHLHVGTLGARAVIAPRHHSAPETGALAKTASGALERQPYLRVTNLADAMIELKEMGYVLIGLDGDGTVTLAEAVAAVGSRPVGLVLGAEGPGLRDKTRETCDVIARVPFSGAFGSLNVSNAAAVGLYAASQRYGFGGGGDALWRGEPRPTGGGPRRNGGTLAPFVRPCEFGRLAGCVWRVQARQRPALPSGRAVAAGWRTRAITNAGTEL